VFYFKFIENKSKFSTGNWINNINDTATNVWAGLAFEQICWDHIQNIKRKLGIDGIYSEISTWNKVGDKSSAGAQIDLIIDRKDRVINLFEIKFVQNSFLINKAYDLKLRNKVAIFKESSQTKKSVFLTMITTFGLVQNEYSRSIVHNEINMDDLFEKVRLPNY
jgi:hypothetical protein